MPKTTLQDFIADNIVNLESKLDATLHFGDSMEDDKKKKGAIGAAAGAAGAAGAVGGAAYLRGRKVAGPVRSGAGGVVDTMRKGASGFRGDAKSAAAATTSGVRTARSAGKGLLRKVGKVGKTLAKHMSAVDVLTNLSARADDLISFKVHDVVGSHETQTKKRAPNLAVITGVGAGTLAAGAAAGVYARGRNTSGHAHKMTPRGVGDTMKRGAGALRGDASRAGASVKRGAGVVKKKAAGAFGGIKARILKATSHV